MPERPPRDSQYRRPEILHVTTQDHIARMANRQDDLRFRKHPVDHRQPQHVQGILVDQPRIPFTRHLAASEKEVTLAQFVTIALIQLAEVAWDFKSRAVLQLA